MKITSEDLGSRQVLLTIEIDEKRVEKALRGVARRIAKEYSIPGFRRGHAPYRVILQRFGREALLQEALEDLGQDVYQEALESEDLEPYDVGSLEDVQLDPLVLKMRVPLRPTVDLGDYRELREEPPVVVVDEEKIDAELEALREANVVLEPVTDRPAQVGDMVSLDVSADVGDESYAHEEAYTMTLGAEEEESFAPGFVEQVAGTEAGGEKSFTLTVPDDVEDFAGQEAAFTVTLHEIKSRLLPDLDDDLARTVGDFDTLEELRQDIRNRFEEAEQRQADEAYTEQVIEKLAEGAEIEYPPDLIEDQVEEMFENLGKRMEDQGMLIEDYFKLSGQTEEDMRESLRARAEGAARRALALTELARQEKLDVEGGEIDERIALLSAGWGERSGEVQEYLSSPEGLRSIASDLLTDKAVQRLLAIARGEAPPLEGEDGEGAEESSEEPEAVQVEAGADRGGDESSEPADEPEGLPEAEAVSEEQEQEASDTDQAEA